MKTRHVLPLSLSLFLTSTASWAQAPLYIEFSPGSFATDVTVTSDDVVVVGRQASGGPVFRWTYSSGVETSLGQASATTAHVSVDGASVSGTESGISRAAYWNVVTQIWTTGPSMGAMCGSDETFAYGISGDGLTIVGGGYLGPGACAGPHADAWHLPATIQDLGGFFSDPASRAFDANFDGSIVVGWKDLLNGTRQGARWVNGALTQLFWTDPSTSIPYRMRAATATNSSSGTVLVSGLFGAPAGFTNMAWRWDAATGNATPLADVGTGTPTANDVSDDGNLIVGAGSTGPLIWVNNVPNDLCAYLNALGYQGTCPTGSATAISRDGLAICGSGSRGWVLIFPGALHVGTAYCFGDGTATACPCGNAGLAGRGCGNSVNASGAQLSATGVASISADSVELRGQAMPNSSALYYQGTTQQSGGVGAIFGDGLRCAAGAVIRIGTKLNASGASRYPDPGDARVSVRGLVTSPGVRTYQIWYRNAAAFCTTATFNLSAGLEITWGA